MTDIRTDVRVGRIHIQPKENGAVLTQTANKLYRIVLGHMKKENKRTIWLHDAESCKLLAAPMAELRKILPELRDAGYLFLRQSRFGCQFSLEDPTRSSEAV